MKRDGSYLCDKNSKMKTRQIDSDKIFFQTCINLNHLRQYVAGFKGYNTKFVLTDDDIIKEIKESNDERTWILVTSDSLPYKMMIEIIKNNFICCECGENIKFTSEIKEHKDKTSHNEFYQKYGNIIMNIGFFHYCQAMLRCLTKLGYELDIKELTKSIYLESSKAQFLVSKCTDFRKSMDILRTCRAAKLQELVFPFCKYAKENGIEASLNQYFL